MTGKHHLIAGTVAGACVGISIIESLRGGGKDETTEKADQRAERNLIWTQYESERLDVC